MQRHTLTGHALLTGSGNELLELAATIALTHHERVDGSGYPQCLTGEEIPIEGRIVALADDGGRWQPLDAPTPAGVTARATASTGRWGESSIRCA